MTPGARRTVLAGVLWFWVLVGCTVQPAGTPMPSLHPEPEPPAVVRTETVSQQSWPLPTGIVIPAIGAESSDVVPLGLGRDRVIDVPPLSRVHQFGYYCPGGVGHCGSPLPGERGPSVVLALVDGNGKLGLFNGLWKLKAGDAVNVNLAGGKVAHFTVKRVQIIAKTKFPTEAVYGVVDHPALRLLTCGPGKAVAGSYLMQTIIYADLKVIK